MYRYEEYLSRTQKLNFSNEQWEKIWSASAADSIEHIFPKSRAAAKQRHRLGNLVLLPPKLNSTLNDDDPKDKADAYRKTGLLIAGAVADAIEDGGWKPKSIDEREQALLAWAATEWDD